VTRFSLIIASTLIAVSSAQAADVAFSGLTDSQTKNLIREFSGNFVFSSVSGAGALGKLFGVEVGVVGGLTTTDEIDKLAKQADPDVDASKIPHGGLLARLSVPLGLTGELLYLPTIGKKEEFAFNTMGLAVKWTITDTLLELPVDLALRGHFSKSKLQFSQNLGTPIDVDFDDTTMGLTALVSKSFIVVAPYAGIGYVKGDGDFKLSASGSTFFDTLVDSRSASDSSLQYLAGVEVNLLFLKLGAEFSHQLDVNRFTLKTAFYF